MITPITDESHALAAQRILTTPDVHLVLAMGGDHLEGGIAAVQVALADPTLRPHFAYTEARRVGTRFMRRAANVPQAAELLVDAVVNFREIEKAAEILKKGKPTATKAATTSLRNKGNEIGASAATMRSLESIK